jgi:hypothetical protein
MGRGRLLLVRVDQPQDRTSGAPVMVFGVRSIGVGTSFRRPVGMV